DSQAVRSLSAGMAEGRGQCLHRENRLPAPGRVVVNILPVNGYGLTLTLPNGIAISGLHASNIELLGAIMRLL
ncbi:hypothetical protein ACEUAO_21450, partial [Aeromonas caviae]